MRVGDMLRQVVEGCSNVVHESRVDAVAKVVEGIVEAGRLVPASIGRNLPGTCRPKHGHQVRRSIAGQRSHGERSPLFPLVHRASPSSWLRETSDSGGLDTRGRDTPVVSGCCADRRTGRCQFTWKCIRSRSWETRL
jgi:hypothetical protein